MPNCWRSPITFTRKGKSPPEEPAALPTEHLCTASIGLALFLHDTASHDDILKWADAAMYEAKKAGKSLIRVHRSEG